MSCGTTRTRPAAAVKGPVLLAGGLVGGALPAQSDSRSADRCLQRREGSPDPGREPWARVTLKGRPLTVDQTWPQIDGRRAGTITDADLAALEPTGLRYRNFATSWNGDHNGDCRRVSRQAWQGQLCFPQPRWPGCSLVGTVEAAAADQLPATSSRWTRSRTRSALCTVRGGRLDNVSIYLAD